jgi:hypothetical protein
MQVNITRMIYSDNRWTIDPKDAHMPEDRVLAFVRGDWSYVGIVARGALVLKYGDMLLSLYVESPGIWGVESDAGVDHFRDLYLKEAELLKNMIMMIPQSELKFRIYRP